MSADLFAEFNSQTAPSSTHPQSNSLLGEQPKSPSHDGNSASHPMPTWSLFENSSTSMSGCTQDTQPTTTAPPPADDDDGWGDFEVADQTAASVAIPAPTSQANATIPTIAGWDSLTIASGPQQSRLNVAQDSTTSVVTHNALDLGPFDNHSTQRPESDWSQRASKTRVRMKAAPSDPNVLFDADDFELQDAGEDEDESDDFGDFEAIDPTPRMKAAAPVASSVASALDLLGLDDPPIEIPRKNMGKEELRAYTGPLSFGAMSTTTNPQSTQVHSHKSQPLPSEVSDERHITVRPVLTSKSSRTAPDAKKNPAPTANIPLRATSEDDEWPAWDDFPGSNGGSNVAPAANKTAISNDAGQSWVWGEGKEGCSSSVKVDDNVPPPINVPPPAILLSAFPELFRSGDFLFKSVSGQSTTIKQQVLSNPKTVNFLRGYVLIATTAARIIAGRKHRWHRDKMLAKSMSISAAGGKGMKLAGVDKTQSTREDREAADVVATWKEYVGRLRSAVATAKSTNLRVPELTESPQIQTAKMVPTATKSCIICGLKREERVTKVDFDVEDSFGEWWVDHWGHRACKNFWIQHEERLRQR
ncbi:hypothetical protein C2857_006050 [Epichloe festucae Fl1]|uniref:Serine/threonine-protein kinase ppk6 n=1 Tax=Epichloe festucae (strain Fl1) TaxID=877507 RepID=A0A7S9KT75_EPIFF|nr:hypothetical protein C2857_006050 [Epichloe festucae Fl1]